MGEIQIYDGREAIRTSQSIKLCLREDGWRRTRSETYDVEAHALDVIQLAGESLVGPSTVTPTRVSHEDEPDRTK
jgi:hypothetical protein